MHGVTSSFPFYFLEFDREMANDLASLVILFVKFIHLGDTKQSQIFPVFQYFFICLNLIMDPSFHIWEWNVILPSFYKKEYKRCDKPFLLKKCVNLTVMWYLWFTDILNISYIGVENKMLCIFKNIRISYN